MSKRTEFGHSIKKSNWTLWEAVFPKDLDDAVTTVSTVWDDLDKVGETMWLRQETKTFFEMRDAVKRKMHSDEKKAIAFHNKILKEANDERDTSGGVRPLGKAA